MKSNRWLMMVVILLSSSMGLAQKSEEHDFEALIEEGVQQEKSLNSKIGSHFPGRKAVEFKRPEFNKTAEALLRKGSPEVVAVPDSAPKKSEKRNAQQREASTLDRRNLDRFSTELIENQ